MLPEQHKTISLSYLISESIVGNIKMQELLYQKLAVPMYYVCLRYVKNAPDDEDVLQEGFIKVFKNLASYKNEGSFEGWVKRIFVNTAINHFNKNKKCFGIRAISQECCFRRK